MTIKDIVEANERESITLKKWLNELQVLANNKEVYVLDRFEAYKHVDFCEKRIMGLQAQIQNFKELAKKK
jgi:hypothetical protein